MKYLIASDIHGYSNSLKLLINKYKDLNCEKIILLGDYLGSDEIENNKIIDMLTLFKDDIICLLGNCDYYDFANFPVELRECFSFYVDKRLYYFCHGNNLNDAIDMFAELTNVYIVFGHTHMNASYKSGNINFINIASVSLPRHNSLSSYGILTDKSIDIYDLNDNLIFSK